MTPQDEEERLMMSRVPYAELVEALIGRQAAPGQVSLQLSEYYAVSSAIQAISIGWPRKRSFDTYLDQKSEGFFGCDLWAET
jgi:hypothetical protein